MCAARVLERKYVRDMQEHRNLSEPAVFKHIVFYIFFILVSSGGNLCDYSNTLRAVYDIYDLEWKLWMPILLLLLWFGYHTMHIRQTNIVLLLLIFTPYERKRRNISKKDSCPRLFVCVSQGKWDQRHFTRTFIYLSTLFFFYKKKSANLLSVSQHTVHRIVQKFSFYVQHHSDVSTPFKISMTLCPHFVCYSFMIKITFSSKQFVNEKLGDVEFALHLNYSSFPHSLFPLSFSDWNNSYFI